MFFNISYLIYLTFLIQFLLPMLRTLFALGYLHAITSTNQNPRQIE